jgi:hypothetical protein
MKKTQPVPTSDRDFFRAGIRYMLTKHAGSVSSADSPNAGALMSSDPEVTGEANRLYWETDTSVAGIAEQLHLSRRALYDVLRPGAAGVKCAVCGGNMVYENRSARSAGQPVCSVCGARPGSEPELTASPEPEQVVVTAGDPGALRLGGVMVMGAIVGAVATLIAVRR